MKYKFTNEDYWRSIILYGLNTATYKIALAKCLYRFTKIGKTKVSMEELSRIFFEEYKNRLKNDKPQISFAGRQTVMEKVIKEYEVGLLSRDEAIEKVKNNAFNDVITRFHTVNRVSIPLKFYEYNEKGLVITDSSFEVLMGNNRESLIEEVNSRWDLLETAFQLKREDGELVNDIRRFYLERGYERQSITENIPVLNGYQKDRCFYCGELMIGMKKHVDHVILRQIIQHDEVWNLVLAHGFCNQQKSDSLPSKNYINKLIQRNEHFIASNHPIKNKLVKQLGKTAKKRMQYINRVYQDAKTVIPYTWEGIRGYNPDTDLLYKAFIRSLRV